MKSGHVLPAAVLLVALLGIPGGVWGDDSATQPHLPRLWTSGALDFYPPAALGEGIEGRALIAFDITPTGHTKNVALVWGEDGVLNAMALHSVTNYQFVVPTDGGITVRQRWRMGFVYCIPPSSQPDAFAVDTAAVVYVRGARRPGAAVRNKPDPKSSSACMKRPDL